MAQVLLHAGLPKTGTTTVQNWLVENAPLLRAEGIFTPAKSQSTHRLAIEGVISRKRRAQPDFRPIMTLRMDEVRREIEGAARDAAISRIVLSSEYFSIAEPLLVKWLLSQMSLSEVTVIFVLRRQDRLIEFRLQSGRKVDGSYDPHWRTSLSR